MSTPARICLISPGHLSTNPRLVKEAFALKSAGYQVFVIHGSFKAWGAANDRAIAAEIGATTAVPFGPIEASRCAYLRQTSVRRAALALAGAGAMLPTVAESAHSPIASDLADEAMDIVADLYIAHYVAALPAAARAAKRHGAPYAFDAEDFHLGDLPDRPKHALEKRIIRAIEGRYLPGAAYVTAASPMIAEAYVETYGIPMPTTVLNVFSKKNTPVTPTSRGDAEPGPSLYWFSQTIGSGRGLETAVEAIAKAQSQPHLYLRGTSAGDYAPQLHTLAVQAGVGARLHILDPAPPDELELLGSSYDLGYIGELAETRNRQIALTNKLFSYLLGGVPSLASDIPAHRRIVPDLGPAMSLFPIGDASALAAAIDSFLLYPDRLKAVRAHAWWLGQSRFNWDVESQKFVTLVRQALTASVRK